MYTDKLTVGCKTEKEIDGKNAGVVPVMEHAFG